MWSRWDLPLPSQLLSSHGKCQVLWRLPSLQENYMHSFSTRALFSVTWIYSYAVSFKSNSRIKNKISGKNVSLEKNGINWQIFYLKNSGTYLRSKSLLASHEGPDQTEDMNQPWMNVQGQWFCPGKPTVSGDNWMLQANSMVLLLILNLVRTRFVTSRIKMRVVRAPLWSEVQLWGLSQLRPPQLYHEEAARICFHNSIYNILFDWNILLSGSFTWSWCKYTFSGQVSMKHNQDQRLKIIEILK